ncbi:MAG: sensor histidine kinase [Blastococcus sp.]
MTVVRRALRVLRGRPVLVDSALAIVLLVAGQLEVAHPTPSSGFIGTAPVALSAALTAAIVAPLPWRRRAPVPVLCAVGLLIAVPHVFADVSLPFFGGLVVLLVATFTASRWADARAAGYSLLVPFAALGVLTFTVPRFDVGSEYVFAVPVFLLVWGAGYALRRWETQSRRLEAALAELAATHEAQTAAVVLDERARIARELHDVIAHSVSVMLLQSGSARLSLHRAPERAQEALGIIEATGRQAMVEMRNLVGVLRPREQTDELAPAPGLGELPALEATMRRSGLEATVRVVGDPRAVPAGLELSAYRIVQEALTNALKHAGRTRACALVTCRADDLHLRIVNEPPTGAPQPNGLGGGHGVVGMRERVSLYGGQMHAGPRADGGYVVDVHFPLGVTS